MIAYGVLLEMQHFCLGSLLRCLSSLWFEKKNKKAIHNK